MYNFFLSLHSWLRWGVLIFGLIAIIKAYSGWFGRKTFTTTDNKISTIFIAFVHSQFLIGLILYIGLSPITDTAFQNFGSAMKDSILRFWAIEHISLMLFGVIFAQVGRSLSKKAVEAVTKHKKAAIFYTISLLLILSAIPWPFLKAARPLFRF